MKRSIAAALALLATQPVNADVTLINVFEVPEGQRDAVILQWEAAADLLRGQPGYVSTSLHASLDPEARFGLVNVALWESVGSFRAAMEVLRTSGAYPVIEGLGINPSLYEVIRDDGQGR
jgi:hypothetical protein